MIINIPDGMKIPDEDLVHVMNTIQRAMQWLDKDRTVVITINKRTPQGWLENQIMVRTNDGKYLMFIAAIQREIGSPSEFHT